MEAKTTRSISDFNTALKLKGFNVFALEDDAHGTKRYSRKDFYKICLTTGKSVIHYADRSFEANDTVLFFGNPHIPYAWETLSRRYVGYTCLFSKEFLKLSERNEPILQSPLFKLGGTPILSISEEQRLFLNQIFGKMIEEQATDYAYKDDLIRNYIHLILHEALKMKPSEQFEPQRNAASRLTAVFLELLERQFPIETVEKPLSLRRPQDYAQNLNIHVNYLNKVVKEVTGKPTSTHILERIFSEAKALLLHTNWNVSEIAYALGFEYPSYFNNFFKKISGGLNPSALRQGLV